MDWKNPIDLSIPLRSGEENPNCYWADDPDFETIRTESFIGDVSKGGSVNYQKVSITPHGNGTHTECYGHLDPDHSVTVNRFLDRFHFVSELVSLSSVKTEEGDLILSYEDYLSQRKYKDQVEALIIRTLPNSTAKLTQRYSGTNPTYLDHRIAEDLAKEGIKHLLIDLPSVDREEDGGLLRAHKAFWNYPGSTRRDCTITELIYVPEKVQNGLYFLNLMISPLEIDASPSKPIIYGLKQKKI